MKTPTTDIQYLEAIKNLASNQSSLIFPCAQDAHFQCFIEQLYTQTKKSLLLLPSSWNDLSITKLSIVLENGIVPEIFMRSFLEKTLPETIAAHVLFGDIILYENISEEKYTEYFGATAKRYGGDVGLTVTDTNGYAVDIRNHNNTKIQRSVSFRNNQGKIIRKKLESMV